MGKWPQSGRGPLPRLPLHPKEGHGGGLQVKTSLGLEIADLRCRVRHEDGISGFEDRSHALRKARVSLARLSNLGPACILPRLSTPDFLTDSCSPAVAVAGEPAANSAAFGRVDAQEKVGCWCTTVEGIEAEVKAAGFAKNKVRKLLQACFWVLLAPRASARPAGSGRRRLHPFAPAPFGSGCCT